MTSIAVIGGGISGLSAAYHIRQMDPTVDITLLESNSSLGGVIQTNHQNGFTIESAADNFITTTPDAVDLCRQVGLEDQLIAPAPIGRQAMVLCRGKLLPIPPGFIVMAPSRVWPLVTTRILSTIGKMRAGCELFVPKRKKEGDESLQSFVCRRFGHEMFDRLVQPLVGGIYTADPKMLSLAATMPRFLQMEQQYGSLLRGAIQQRRQQPVESSGGARYSQFLSLKRGLSSLIQAMENQLPAESIKRNASVVCLRQAAHGGWSIRVAESDPSWLNVDGVVLATPASQAARLLAGTDEILSGDLSEIPYSSCAVISLGFRQSQIGIPLNSFGFVVPIAEHRLILSCSFSSVKYAERAPEGCVLLRVFIGGACQSGLLRLPNEHLLELAYRELSDIMSIKGEPVISDITMQWNAMPQYHVGHCERVAAIENRLQRWPTLAIAGSALHGVGVPSCLASGRLAAARLLGRLASQQAVSVAT